MTDHNSPPAGAGAGAAQDNPQLFLGTFAEDAVRSESSEGATDEDSSKQYHSLKASSKQHHSLRESIRMEEIKKLQQQLKSFTFMDGEDEGDVEIGSKPRPRYQIPRCFNFVDLQATDFRFDPI